MNNLELKHLCAYAPYGVKCYVDFKDEDTGDVVYIPTHYLDLDNIERYLKNRSTGLIALRPIIDFLDTPTDFKNDFGEYLKNHIALGLYGHYYKFKNFNVNTWPHGMVQVFIKHHFDVCGLIDAGFAIDLNNIK